MQTTIDLRLYATLQKFMPSNACRFPIKPGMRIAEIVDHLGIPVELSRLIFVDGLKAGPDTALAGGERVAIFPPIGGG